MSTGLTQTSQVEFWREKPENTPPPPKNINVKPNNSLDAGGAYLSYNWFVVLSVLGGFLALDHLYLRSPLTFLAKLVINILGLGVWWLYDASQALFNKDVVKVFGLGVPGLGPMGIAAGSLASDVPDKKHSTFFLYSLALIFGGIFGADSFLTGDKRSGFIRLVSLITVVFSAVAIVWWVYNLFKFFFSTKSVIESNWEYFGAPPPYGPASSVFDIVGYYFPFLAPVLGLTKIFVNTAETVAANPDIVLKGPLGRAAQIAAEAASPVVVPVTTAVESVAEAAEAGAKAVSNVAQTATTALETAKSIGDDVAQAVGPIATLATQAATLEAGLTPEAIRKAASGVTMNAETLTNGLQSGGNIQSNLLGYTLLGSMALIAVSGFLLTLRRSKENGTPSERNDSPPEPGVL
jgi:hypothetical protein